MDRYCLDANVFIQAKNGPYGFDIVPSFWSFLDSAAADDRVYSSRYVYKELTAGKDELATWAKGRRSSNLFVVPNAGVQVEYAQVVNYVSNTYTHPKSVPHANLFLAKADPWIIAQAIADGSVVVTWEDRADPNSKKVQVPNVCNHFGVRTINTYMLLRILEIKL